MIEVTQQLSRDEAITRLTLTTRYRIAEGVFNGKPAVVIDFLDGNGYIAVDPTAHLLAAMESASLTRRS